MYSRFAANPTCRGSCRTRSEAARRRGEGYLNDGAGIAVFKKAYQIYRESGYRIRLLSAAFRNHMHWSEFIGGDVVISPPYPWQVRYNASDIPVVPRIDNPVDPKIIAELSKKFVDFRRAYAEDGLSLETFDSLRLWRERQVRDCRKIEENLQNSHLGEIEG